MASASSQPATDKPAKVTSTTSDKTATEEKQNGVASTEIVPIPGDHDFDVGQYYGEDFLPISEAFGTNQGFLYNEIIWWTHAQHGGEMIQLDYDFEREAVEIEGDIRVDLADLLDHGWRMWIGRTSTDKENNTYLDMLLLSEHTGRANGDRTESKWQPLWITGWHKNTVNPEQLEDTYMIKTSPNKKTLALQQSLQGTGSKQVDLQGQPVPLVSPAPVYSQATGSESRMIQGDPMKMLTNSHSQHALSTIPENKVGWGWNDFETNHQLNMGSMATIPENNKWSNNDFVEQFNMRYMAANLPQNHMANLPSMQSIQNSDTPAQDPRMRFQTPVQGLGFGVPVQDTNMYTIPPRVQQDISMTPMIPNNMNMVNQQKMVHMMTDHSNKYQAPNINNRSATGSNEPMTQKGKGTFAKNKGKGTFTNKGHKGKGKGGSKNGSYNQQNNHIAYNMYAQQYDPNMWQGHHYIDPATQDPLQENMMNAMLQVGRSWTDNNVQSVRHRTVKNLGTCPTWPTTINAANNEIRQHQLVEKYFGSIVGYIRTAYTGENESTDPATYILTKSTCLYDWFNQAVQLGQRVQLPPLQHPQWVIDTIPKEVVQKMHQQINEKGCIRAAKEVDDLLRKQQGVQITKYPIISSWDWLVYYIFYIKQLFVIQNVETIAKMKDFLENYTLFGNVSTSLRNWLEKYDNLKEIRPNLANSILELECTKLRDQVLQAASTNKVLEKDILDMTRLHGIEIYGADTSQYREFLDNLLTKLLKYPLNMKATYAAHTSSKFTDKPKSFTEKTKNKQRKERCIKDMLGICKDTKCLWSHDVDAPRPAHLAEKALRIGKAANIPVTAYPKELRINMADIQSTEYEEEEEEGYEQEYDDNDSVVSQDEYICNKMMTSKPQEEYCIPADSYTSWDTLDVAINATTIKYEISKARVTFSTPEVQKLLEGNCLQWVRTGACLTLATEGEGSCRHKHDESLRGKYLNITCSHGQECPYKSMCPKNHTGKTRKKLQISINQIRLSDEQHTFHTTIQQAIEMYTGHGVQLGKNGSSIFDDTMQVNLNKLALQNVTYPSGIEYITKQKPPAMGDSGGNGGTCGRKDERYIKTLPQTCNLMRSDGTSTRMQLCLAHIPFVLLQEGELPQRQYETKQCTTAVMVQTEDVGMILPLQWLGQYLQNAGFSQQDDTRRIANFGLQRFTEDCATGQSVNITTLRYNGLPYIHPNETVTIKNKFIQNLPWLTPPKADDTWQVYKTSLFHN